MWIKISKKLKQEYDILDHFIDKIAGELEIKKYLKLFIFYCFKTKTFPDEETLQTYLEVIQMLDIEIVMNFMQENEDLIKRTINLIQRNNVFYQQKKIGETKEVKIIPLVKHIFKED